MLLQTVSHRTVPHALLASVSMRQCAVSDQEGLLQGQALLIALDLSNNLNADRSAHAHTVALPDLAAHNIYRAVYLAVAAVAPMLHHP